MNTEKKTNLDIAQVVENCTRIFALHEFSRVTGVRIELLRRFINKQARQARAETWGKIYPSIRQLLEDEAEPQSPPKRLGPAYRRHAELVDMVSDQKVLLDVFGVFGEAEQQRILCRWSAGAEAAEPTAFKSLSPAENRLMGAYLAMTPENRAAELLGLVKLATAELRRQRERERQS